MDWKNPLWMGLIGGTGESALLFYFMKYTTAARSNLLTNISPVVAAIMSYFVTKEANIKFKINARFCLVQGALD